MIKRFTIEGFESLESVTVELGRINVFIGANGSGKSNLLEALGVIGAAAFGRGNEGACPNRAVHSIKEYRGVGSRSSIS